MAGAEFEEQRTAFVAGFPGHGAVDEGFGEDEVVRGAAMSIAVVQPVDGERLNRR